MFVRACARADVWRGIDLVARAQGEAALGALPPWLLRNKTKLANLGRIGMWQQGLTALPSGALRGFPSLFQVSSAARVVVRVLLAARGVVVRVLVAARGVVVRVL